ncbi:homoserine dehydrogenase [Usitatibacter palustris]|uniref:Homoserine dehydrogenase n=1 Tax=Usitatibacter palustris TaxID=2732487 RepID=A0A6M4HBP3_9PROT|nr:homoserine dehydrogenase [Usitatibacter palustris]QJR15387.1 Homoserine dehydrogenase [Usitatibacter palustris]
MKPMQVGLLGLGTVGGGTVDVLRRNREEIARRAGRDIVVKVASARDLKKQRTTNLEGIELIADPAAIIARPDIDIVVELIGGDTIARELVLKAIDNGKHVVTANKALLAKHGTEIFLAAQKKGVMVAFEGAVAGGIPIIKAIREGLSANRIEWIAGIINGTCNYILSEMRDKGLPFDMVLAEAQRLGYAEADPAFDIEGIDAAHKLTILSAIAFGIPMQFDKVYTEGIAKLTAIDIKYAEGLGYRIKLLGITRRTDKGIELRVHPTLIPARRLIANVEGVMNAVLVKGDAVGASLYYGRGAGAEATASAVVADLVDVTRMATADPEHRVPHLAFQPDRLSDAPILGIEQVTTASYLRLRAYDRPGVLADVTRICADNDISIDAIFQKEAGEGEDQVDVVILTHAAPEKNVNAAIRRIEALPTIPSPVVRIRLEELL